MKYFIDKLHVHQDHLNGGLPIIGEELISRYAISTGEFLRETCNPSNVEGSFSTKFRVKCDGYRVSVEANPSKWNRIDNLFGLYTFDECINLYNIELLKLGLPPFTKTTKVNYLQSPEDGKFHRITDGAIFRRVDMTRNLAVGRGNEHHFLRGLSSQRIGKGILPLLHADQTTLEWKTKSWYHKLYTKAVEMMLPSHRKYIKKLTEDEINYRNKIVGFCQDIGLVRDEKEFKQPFLNRNDLCCYGLVSEKDFLKHLTDIDNIISRIEVSTMDYEHISDTLIEQGICPTRQSANSTQSQLFAWLYGQPIEKTSQYYVHKARLLQLGIDISVPHDVTRLMPQLRNNREINVSTALPPDWYEMPLVEKLRLVA